MGMQFRRIMLCHPTTANYESENETPQFFLKIKNNTQTDIATT
jgi:hypothetical protein